MSAPAVTVNICDWTNMKVRLSCSPGEFIYRQSPGGRGDWGDSHFDAGGAKEGYDAWVVYESLAGRQVCVCDPARIVFVAGEPPSIRTYDQRFLSQFSAIVAPRNDLLHPRVFQQQASIPWWIGCRCVGQRKDVVAKSFDDFARIDGLSKPKLLSIVCSSRSMTEGHRKRLALVEELKEHFGDEIDVFGQGFKHVEDKWEAIAPYKYHVTIENSSVTHYWTEKLADVLLVGALPLYWGCPNLKEYFPPGSYIWIDRDDPQKAAATIRRAVDEHLFEASAGARAQAKELVLNRYNLFPAMLDVLSRLPIGPKRTVILKPERDFTDQSIRVLARHVKQGLRNLMIR